MPLTDTEKALRRGLAYQYWSGLAQTPETEKRVIESLFQALDRREPDPVTAVMADLTVTPLGNEPTPPEPTPAIRRGSLHYGDY